jgi:hypothetical protein
MNHTRSAAQPLATQAFETAATRRRLLMLLVAATALAWSAHTALGQTRLDENGAPIRLPGQTSTPEIQDRERAANQQMLDSAIQNRSNLRMQLQQQQFRNDRAQAQQRENTVQQNFLQQQQDILNNRDKP